MEKLTRFSSHEELKNRPQDTSVTADVVAARHAIFESFINALKAGKRIKASEPQGKVKKQNV